MDALSEILRLSRFGANVTLDAAAHEPWCVSVPASESVGRAHVIVDGECLLRTAHGDEATLPPLAGHLERAAPWRGRRPSLAPLR